MVFMIQLKSLKEAIMDIDALLLLMKKSKIDFKQKIFVSLIQQFGQEKILTYLIMIVLIPNRGKRNSSLNLNYVAEELSQIQGIDKEELIAVTEENARKLYRMKEV